MARTNINLPDDIDKAMRHEAVELGLRYPGELMMFLWKQYNKYKSDGRWTAWDDAELAADSQKAGRE